MTESELDEIEVAVEFSLPSEYQRVVLENPSRPIGQDCVYWFYDDPGRVIENISLVSRTFLSKSLSMIFRRGIGGRIHRVRGSTAGFELPVCFISWAANTRWERRNEFPGSLRHRRSSTNPLEPRD